MSAADILVYGAEDKVFPSPQDITLSRVSKRNFKSTSVEFNAANADSRLLKKGKKKKKYKFLSAQKYKMKNLFYTHAIFAVSEVDADSAGSNRRPTRDLKDVDWMNSIFGRRWIVID